MGTSLCWPEIMQPSLQAADHGVADRLRRHDSQPSPDASAAWQTSVCSALLC